VYLTDTTLSLKRNKGVDTDVTKSYSSVEVTVPTPFLQAVKVFIDNIDPED